MSDTIGRITVPAPTSSGLTFPLTPDFPYAVQRTTPVITHRFGELATKAEQRFEIGTGPRRFAFRRSSLSVDERNELFDFYEQMQGSFQNFTYNAPNPDGSTTGYLVVFDQQPLSINELSGWCESGFYFVEVATSTPSYTVASTDVRFPGSTLEAALLSQVQQLIPLIHIRVVDGSVADIYLSDRRCSVGGQLYLARVLGLGEPNSDILMSQNIDGSAESMSLQFGNADRVMSQLANDCELQFAEIDVSFYHINTGILLQFWKGEIQNYQVDGSPTFSVAASDTIHQLTRQYPPHVTSRTCWKTFNDGVNCPWASVSGVGDATGCDFYFDSPNGCQSHGMDIYFGAHPAQPQGVTIRDNGLADRNFVNATSIISDTSWGKPIPQIWSNDHGNPDRSFWQACLVIAGRDESDFFDALGIIGEGPIGAFAALQVFQNADGYRYIIAPLVDGQPPHGFKVDSDLTLVTHGPILGYRLVSGTDPVVAATDSFSLGQGSPQVWGPQMSAGTAFAEVRIVDTPGIQPTLPEQHTMSVPISQGLAGFKWNASDTRSTVSGLCNPFWVGVNCYLRALGLQNASAAAQLAKFVRSSLFDGAGNGCAEIADLVVNSLVGGGTETQFEFQGVLAQGKPFCDWLKEIIRCALGYFTFEFGRLSLGTRENASVTETFTRGNMLYRSLTLTPIDARFEKAIVDFADAQYQYQANTAEYEDKSHSALYGRAGNPLVGNIHLVGCGSLSQASRIAAVETREEIGGIDADEWRTARQFKFSSTILSLKTAIGKVISITDPDVPGGTAKFRVKRIQWKKDYSVDFYGQSVTDSMYDLISGPKPMDVLPRPLPALFYPQPLGPVWAPFDTQAPATDALFPSEWTFNVRQQYDLLADNKKLCQVVCRGKFPANRFLAGAGAPVVKAGQIAVATTGGSLPGGKTYRVAVCGRAGDFTPTPPSEILIIKTPTGTNTNKITISGILWPPVTGLVDAVVFASDQDDLICRQQIVSLSGGPTYTPTSIVITGPFERSSWGLPDPALSFVRVKAKLAFHVGVVGAEVTAVSGSVVTAAGAADLAAIDNWASRVLFSLGRREDVAPFVSWNVTAFNPATGAFTLSQPAVVGGHPELSLQVGDAIAVAFKGYDNSATPTVFTDAGISNAGNYDIDTGVSTPHSGLTPHDPREIGRIGRIIKGFNRGALAKVVDNDATSYTFDQSLLMDATSILIIEDGGWPYQMDAPIANANPIATTEISLPTDNFLRQTMLLGGFTVDENGFESPDGDAPVRMVYIWGKGISRKTVSADYTIQNGDEEILCDTSSNPITITLKRSDLVDGQMFEVVNFTGPNAVTVVVEDGGVILSTTGIASSMVLPNQGDSAGLMSNG